MVNDMNSFLFVETKRTELIKELKRRKVSKEEIDKFIAICDRDYKEYGIAYPTINDFKDAK